VTYNYAAALAAGRNRNKVFGKIVKAIADSCREQGITQKDLADRIGRKPAQLSKWLSGPSNWTLDTVSDLLFCIDAEIECEVIFNKDRRKSNQFNHQMEVLMDQQYFLDHFSPQHRLPLQKPVQVLNFQNELVN
jgi:transcriptional regulator with XRE-family HTH domain